MKNFAFIILFFAGFLSIFAASSRASSLNPEASQIIERHVLSSGGKVNLLSLKSITRIGKIQFFAIKDSPFSGTFSYHTDIIYPSKLREYLGETQILVDRGTNGSYFWERKENRYLEVQDTEQKRQMRETAERANRDILWIQDEFDFLKISPYVPNWAPDSKCLVGSKNSSETYICFDNGTGLMSAKGNQEEYRLFLKWTKIKNILLPFQIIHFRKKEKAYEILLNSVDIDHTIDPARFLLPSP